MLSALLSRKIAVMDDILRLTSLLNCGIELTVHAGNMFLEARVAKYTPQLGIVMNVPRIQVVSNGSLEHCWVLGNDRETATKIKKSNR